MPRDRVERVLSRRDLDLLAPRERTETVAVGDDHCAGHLQQLRDRGIVELRADEHHPCAVPWLRVRLARLKLFKGLAQKRQNQLLRAREAHELDHVKFIARDDGIFRLAEISDLGDDAAELVVPLDRLAQALLREVHAEALGERLHDLLLQLAAEVAAVPFPFFDRHVDAAEIELFVRDQLAVFEILLHAVHRGAALLPNQRGDEIVPALERALEDASGVGAGAVRHVIRGEVRIRAAGRAQADAEAALHVEQRLGNVGAVVGERDFPLGARLPDKGVVRLAQQLLKVGQMLQVSQGVLSSFFRFFALLPI